MRNILLVLKREYLVRVKKKSFIVMTLLTPILFLGFYAAIIWMAVGSIDTKTVQVLDESGLMTGKFEDSRSLKFSYTDISIDAAKSAFEKSDQSALVYIPSNVLEQPREVRIYAKKNVSLELKSGIEKAIERQIEDIKLREAGINQKIIQEARVNVSAQTISLDAAGERKSNAAVATVISMICGMIIYFAVLLYGSQVMRSVTEEKTSRIVEVIISSVRPFQLLLGKIVGVALVGLTQFGLWIGLTVLLTSGASYLFKEQLERVKPEVTQVQSQLPGQSAAVAAAGDNPEILEALDALKTLNIPLIIGCFLFYFLGGYLLYSALFGAVGAAVDNEADTQQFVLPITLPLILAFVMAQMALRDPDGSMSFWGSMIPFTSPIVMMVRIPFGVPAWELALSMVILIVGFIGTIWLAARIYRVGILMYGKKVTYKELAKWVFYKG